MALRLVAGETMALVLPPPAGAAGKVDPNDCVLVL